MRLIVSFLSVLALCLVAPSPAAAREEPLDAYGVLDTWLRAEQLNYRCGNLNYFETQEIERGIAAASGKTPEGVATQGAYGWPHYDSILAQEKAMLEVHRAAAREATASRECGVSDPDVVALQGYYIREYLTAIIAAQTSVKLRNDQAGRKQAAQVLLDFAKALYGPNFDAVVQQISGQLQAQGVDPDVAWESIANPVKDLAWQLRLGEKGYDFVPYHGAPTYFEAVKTDGSGGRFPAKLTHRYHPTYLDAEGYPITISRADGVMDDGRFVTLISKDSAAWGAQTLQAQLLVQKDADANAWVQDDWRKGTLSYTAEVETGPDCPADFCFTFPQEATDAIRIRELANAVSERPEYRYEMVIAEPAYFPLKDVKASSIRDAFHPMSGSAGEAAE